MIPLRQYGFRGNAIYHYLGMKILVEQGGTFWLESQGDETELTIESWGYFPGTIFGKFIEWYSTDILRIEKSLAEHDFGELEEFKTSAEKKKATRKTRQDLA